MTQSVHIVAEAGTTHEGNLETALALVDAAVECGVDSLKFQFIDPLGLYLGKVREGSKLVDNPVVAVREAQRLTEDQWRQVAARSKSVGLPFSASVFDRGTLQFLNTLDPPYIKLASTDLTNDPLIEATCATGRRILLSTGMSGLGEIEHAVKVLHRSGTRDVVLMHCVSMYPCPPAATNIGFVETLKSAFGLPVGFSDHTESSVAAIAAVALGATWLEKHFTYDRNAKGFDHAYAMEPASLASYVSDIRNAEAALTRQMPKVGEAEAKVRERARRSLWAARDLPAGHVVRAEDVLVVRPEGPLTPADLSSLVGRTLSAPVAASEPFRWENCA